MIDGHQWKIQRQTKPLGEGEAHHDAAYKSWAGRRRDAVKFRTTNLGVLKRLGDDGPDGFHMGAGGDFRHHTPEGRMLVDLAQHHRG